jgi:uncharacterized protein YutE (UPF0331/DUF86 family)
VERDVVLRKLETLRRCVERIESKRPPDTRALEQDYDLQDIISVNLERAIQASVDIASVLLAERGPGTPATMGESFPLLADSGIITTDLAERLRKAVGFRNISVHEYEKIDWSIVFSIVTDRLEDFRSFTRSVLAAL